MKKIFFSWIRLFFYVALLIHLSFSSQKSDLKIKPASSFEQSYQSLYSRGESLQQNGDFDKAIVFFEKSLNLARKEGDFKKEIESLSKLGILYWNIGKLKESSNFYTSALSLSRKLNIKEKEEKFSTALQIYNFYSKGKEFRSQDQYQQSIDAFQKAIELSRKINSLEHELKCLRQLNFTYWQQNNFEEFHYINEKAIRIAKFINHLKEEAYCLINNGLYFWKIDNYFESLKHYEHALKIARELNNLEIESECLTNIGIIYLELGNFDKAYEKFYSALKLDEVSGNTSYSSMDLNNLGVTFRKKGLLSNNKDDFNRALDFYKEALKLAKIAGNIKTEIKVLNNIGSVYSDIGNYVDALDYFRSGIKKAEEINDIEEKSIVLNNLGIVYSNLGNYEESTKCYQQAIDLALSLKGGQILWEAYYELANTYKKQNKYHEALQNYKNSISIIEDIRSQIKLEEFRATYFGSDKRIEAYQNLIDLLIKLHSQEPQKNYHLEAFEYLERAKARAFLDTLEVSEINISQGIDQKLLNQEKELMNDISKLYKKLLASGLSSEQINQINEEIKTREEKLDTLKVEIRALSPAYASLKYPEIITLEETQKKLIDNKTAILAYSVGKENSYAFIITNKKFKTYPIPPRRELQENVSKYLRMITDRDNNNFELGFELFQMLVRPGLDKTIKKIIFIPDDILHYLPFEALLADGDKKEWLIKKYTIAYAPSASSLREIIKRRKSNHLKTSMDIVAFGDPSFSSNLSANFALASDFHFTPLKYSGLEIERIASLFKKGKTSVFSKEKATEEELKMQNLSGYKILHFATHGLIDDKKPARSSILLSMDSDQKEDGLLQMREIFNLKLNADLVTLSACQTALGQFIRGEGFEGLSRAFFYAGASSLLVSLWSIDDEASFQLMERFYYHLRSSLSIMDSLQKAKTELIESQVLSHPYYWAGFITIGKANTIIFPKKIHTWPLLLVSLILVGTLFFKVKNLKNLIFLRN